MPDPNQTTKLKLRELTRHDWPIIEELFGEKGACGGCWCMHWRLPRGGKLWEESKGEPNRKAFEKLLTAGKVQGILAFDGPKPVAWSSFGLRSGFPRTERMKAYQRDDLEQVWSINCFFISRGYRGLGLGERLIAKAVAAIKKRKGKIIEAYPTPLTKQGEQLPAAFSFTGPEVIFIRQGFKQIQRLSHSRPLYRLKT